MEWHLEVLQVVMSPDAVALSAPVVEQGNGSVLVSPSVLSITAYVSATHRSERYGTRNNNLEITDVVVCSS